MLQKDHDPDGKPLPRRPNAGVSRGPGVTDEAERKAGAGAEGDVEPGDGTDAGDAPPRSG
jgi:hypothetical protein